MPREGNQFNATYVTSRYKAYDPNGNFREIVSLTNDSKRRYEARGWTFKRTTLREGDHVDSRYH